MARYYCDYCKSYIKNDSSRSRREHIHGVKHRECVEKHYARIFEKYRTIMDERTRGMAMKH